MRPSHCRRGSSQLLFVAFVSALLLCPAHLAGAVEYTVGDDSGWTDSGVNYVTWAQSHNFAVGDVLVFQYLKSQHNLYEVTESTYRSCDASTGVTATYDTGFDKIQLTEAKSYWFICQITGHCQGGMKVAVNVSAAGSPGEIPSPAVQPPPSGSSAASLPAGGRRSWMVLAFCALVCISWVR